MIGKEGYIIFINPKSEDFKDILDGTLYALGEKLSLNCHSNCLVVAFIDINESPAIFSQIVLRVLKSNGIMNSAVLIVCKHCEESSAMIDNRPGAHFSSPFSVMSIFAYTVFPFLDGSCNNENISLIGKWNMKGEVQNDISAETSFISIDLCPANIPNHIAGCTLHAGSFGPAPYVIKENTSTGGGENDFKLMCIGMHLNFFFVSEMNFTVKFIEPTLQIDMYSILKYNYLFCLITYVPFKIDLKLFPRSAFVFINTSSARLVSC